MNDHAGAEWSLAQPELRHVADCSPVIPLAAAWLYHEWGHKGLGSSLERSIRRLQARATKNRIPFSLIAFANSQPIGIASVVEVEDVGDAPGPWVSGVYIVPDYRGKGVGTRLLDAIEVEARRLGTKQLLLSAAVPRLYEAIGHQPTGNWKNGEPIMSKVLARQS